jgi:hypothetical protein
MARDRRLAAWRKSNSAATVDQPICDFNHEEAVAVNANKTSETDLTAELRASDRGDALVERSFDEKVVSDAMAAILADKTPSERLKIAFDMWDFARDLIARTTRAEHPDWSDAKLDRHVAQRMSHGAV